jgi:hypothetical protein
VRVIFGRLGTTGSGLSKPSHRGEILLNLDAGHRTLIYGDRAAPPATLGELGSLTAMNRCSSGSDDYSRRRLARARFAHDLRCTAAGSAEAEPGTEHAPGRREFRVRPRAR